jgi:TPR repeat protein
VPAKWYGPAAERRFNHATYRLGQCYSEGSGVEQDHDKAAEHFSTAATVHTAFSPHGHGEAQSALASCYFDGRGIEQDTESAVYWWRRAASQSVPDACNNLGAAMQLGMAGPRDDRKGFELFLEAARRRHASAEFNVGECYAAGRGVDQDFVEAATWYAMAAKQGYIPAMRNLAICYEHGIGVRENSVLAMELRARMEQQQGENEVEGSFISTSEQKQFRRMAAYFAI